MLPGGHGENGTVHGGSESPRRRCPLSRISAECSEAAGASRDFA